MSWANICDYIDEYAAFGRPVADSVRPHLSCSPFRLTVYAHPIVRKIAFDDQSDASDDYLYNIAKHASLPVRVVPVTRTEAVRDGWVKVAETRPFRVAMENLQYLPSTTAIPNAPSPLAAMIASSLVGAGAGYGVGSLAGAFTSDDWNKKRLKRNSALLGGLAGAAPAVLWAIGNHANGRGMTDPWPVDQQAAPDLESGLPKVAVDSIGYQGVAPRTPRLDDVNVNALGQVLWGGQAPAPLSAAALGTMHAAGQFEDPQAPPGWVTAHQLGQLALATGQGYVMGRVVGKALNIATGMPDQNAGRYGAAVGIINFALPKLFN